MLAGLQKYPDGHAGCPMPQATGQSTAFPLQSTPPGHAGLPPTPALTGLHCPAAPAVLQASQLPAQALSQQTPSLQKPLVHSLPSPQALPVSFLGTHCLLVSQMKPAAQSAAVEQVVVQFADVPLHKNGEQLGRPASPMRETVQVPREVISSQRSHAPLQPVSQQYPSAQNPDRHSPGASQERPLAFSDEIETQRESMQRSVSVQAGSQPLCGRPASAPVPPSDSAGLTNAVQRPLGSQA
jgi:hypothetical protein